MDEQEDYENDFYAAALLNEEVSGVKPIKLLSLNNHLFEKSNAIIIENQHDSNIGVLCRGSLQREPSSKVSVCDYLINTEYVGIKIPISLTGNYNYLVFYGKKESGNGQPTVYIYNEQKEKIAGLTALYTDIDDGWHQYIIDMTGIDGDITIIFNGGYIDNTGNPESKYIFSDITLY